MAVINLATTLASIPVATRGLTFALLAFSSVLFLLRLTIAVTGINVVHVATGTDSAVEFPWLVLVPGSSFWYPWTLLTSAFCETTLTELLISAAALPLAGRYLERIWGAAELLRFSAVVVVASNALSWAVALALYVALRSETAMFGTQYHGMMALQTGFLVALAQVIPEHQVQLFKGAIRIRVKDFPMAYVTVSNVMCLLGQPSPFILIQFGWLVSWAYLRFFKLGEGGMRGDRSETFSFVSWFPPFLHKPVTAISNALYSVFLRLGVVQPWHYSALGDLELGIGSGLGSGPGSAMAGGGAFGGRDGGAAAASAAGAGGPARGGPGGAQGARAEAERRRAMALKALDQRVQSQQQQQSHSQPQPHPTTTTTTTPMSAASTLPPPPYSAGAAGARADAPAYPPAAARTAPPGSDAGGDGAAVGPAVPPGGWGAQAGAAVGARSPNGVTTGSGGGAEGEEGVGSRGATTAARAELVDTRAGKEEGEDDDDDDDAADDDAEGGDLGAGAAKATTKARR